jgi:hypothetical protein
MQMQIQPSASASTTASWYASDVRQQAGSAEIRDKENLAQHLVAT